MSTPERRRAPRVAERLSLTIGEGKSAYVAETKNLSASGAYCMLDQFLPPMTKLALQFDLPNGARHVRVACSGVVVRVEPLVAHADRGRYQIAVFFTDLTERDRAAIMRFVRQRLAAASSATAQE